MADGGLYPVIRDVAAKLGVVALRLNSGGMRVKGGYVHLLPPGTPDFLVLGAHGQCVWLEAKAPGKKLSKEQEEWRRKAARLGHVVELVDSLESVVKAIKEHLDV
jgi:hypothetical protein